MELFVQQVLGAVSLNDHVDEMHEYYRCFSGWVARQRKTWTAHKVVPAAIYHDKIRQHKKTQGERMHLVESSEGLLLISDNLLPWLVFGCHVLLDYSTDVKVVSEFMSRAGFETPPDHVISDILAWSTYPTRLAMSGEEQRFCSSVYALLNSSEQGYFPYCKSGYIKLTWEALYQQHLGSPRLNSMLDQAGIVFFGLVRIEKNIYSVVYMDAMTEAVEFSDLITTYRDFRNPREFVRMARDVTACICAFLNKYGHPRYMVLVNPLSNWLYYVLSRAIDKLWIPTHTEFVAPVQTSDTERLVLKKAEPFLSVVAYVLDQRDISEIPPFKYLKSEDSSWRLTFATNIHWAQNQILSHHPKTLRDDGTSPKLIVASIPGLELVEADPITFRMLKTKPPKRFKCGDCPLSSESQIEDVEVFQDLIKKGEQFSLGSALDYASILVDGVTEKVLTYLWQLKKQEKQDEGSCDVRAVLNLSKQVHQSLNEDDLFWISHGVEINKNGVFGTPDAFEGDRPDMDDHTDSAGRQFHLAREKKEIKKEIEEEEVKRERVVDTDEEEDVTAIDESIVEEEDSTVGEESLLEESGTTSARRVPRKAAEIAATKVRLAYERYKVHGTLIIDSEAPEEEFMDGPVIERRTTVTSPAKRRKVNFGAHFKQLKELGQLGKEMSASMGGEEEEGEKNEEREKEERKEGDKEGVNGNVANEPQSPPFEKAARITVAEPQSPPFEEAHRITVAEPRSPLFEEPDRMVVVKPQSPPFVEADRLVIPETPPTPASAPAPLNIVKDEPMSPSFTVSGLNSPSPEVRQGSQDDEMADYAKLFAHVEISDACPVQRMIDEDVFNNPDAEYSMEPLRYRGGTQYPDGTLGYSSDSEYDDLMDGGYSDIDFGPEYTERMKQRQEQIQYTDADFQLSEEEEWPLLKPGDLQEVYETLKIGCGD